MEIEISENGKVTADLGNGMPTADAPNPNAKGPIFDAQGNKTVNLPSGKVAIIAKFLGKHVREAQKIAGGESDKVMFAIIALTTTIDSKPTVMEDLDEMDGMDVMTLYGQFGSNFSSAPSK